MSLLDQPAARAAYQRQQTMSLRAAHAQVASRYEFVRPFGAAAEELVDWMAQPDDRLTFGLPPIDARLRGVGRGELCFITGKAHSGKTQLVLHLLDHEKDKRLLFFTPDEVDSLVLCKLLAITHGLDVKALEKGLKADDAQIKNLIRRVANDEFANLIVVDRPLTFQEMERAKDEAEDHWGDACEGVIVDYLDLLPGGDGDYQGTKAKAVGLKRWTKTYDVPVICVHQPKRGGARRGQTIGMDDMNMGGETEGTFVLGVFRKRDDEYLDEEDRLAHANTVSVAISKNKRPPCEVGTFDFYLDAANGQIRELQPTDMMGRPFTLHTVTEAQRWRRG